VADCVCCRTFELVKPEDYPDKKILSSIRKYASIKNGPDFNPDHLLPMEGN